MEQGCIVCRAPLVYSPVSREMTCDNCGKKEMSNMWCENGHYICNDCHSAPAVAIITAGCLNAAREGLTDPIALARRLMLNPAVELHGPEHHYLTPAVLLAAAKNAGRPDLELPTALADARERARNVLGGFCGYYGACGAGVGAGIFVSVLTGATPCSDESLSHALAATGSCLMKFSEFGGPRCCKRSTLTAIVLASRLANRELGLSISLPERIGCAWREKNRECSAERCPFYRGTGLAGI